MNALRLSRSIAPSVLILAVAAVMGACASPGEMAKADGMKASAASPGGEGPQGMVTLKSPRSVADTMARLEATVKERGFAVVAKVDHAAGAQRVGKTLRPTQLLIFGNPAGGTAFMECTQTAGIDLPMKALVWEDALGQVNLSYNDPSFISARHQPSCAAGNAMSAPFGNVMKAVVAP